MYEYRTLTVEQRAELVRQRVANGYPLHAPPHPVQNEPFYLLTAACYEHACHMQAHNRRRQLMDGLFELFIAQGVEIVAWVVLPNHYHLLLQVADLRPVGRVFRLVHGRMSRAWNLEDSTPGRRTWFRFTDRAIRSERHYCTTLNYIHYNPVKHGWAKSPYDWTDSSIHWYSNQRGRDWLRDLWISYPVRDYGRGWDDLT